MSNTYSISSSELSKRKLNQKESSFIFDKYWKIIEPNSTLIDLELNTFNSYNKDGSKKEEYQSIEYILDSWGKIDAIAKFERMQAIRTYSLRANKWSSNNPPNTFTIRDGRTEGGGKELDKLFFLAKNKMTLPDFFIQAFYNPNTKDLLSFGKVHTIKFLNYLRVNKSKYQSKFNGDNAYYFSIPWTDLEGCGIEVWQASTLA